MALVFSLVAASDVPIYRQIVQHIRRAVVQGQLERGEQLPAVRTLAESLVINPNTVARAYLELEREGVVQKRHGSGTYISDTGSPLGRKERLKILSGRIDALLAEARNLRIEPAELMREISERSEQIQPKTMK